MRKIMTFILVCSSMLVSTLAFAESPHEFSANVSLTTDYMYRGISQSDEQPAISGGFDYGHESGVYAGIWASSLDFNDGDTGIEIDYYGGVGGEFSSGISWDVGGLYYQYPGTNADAAGDFDFFEVYGNLGYTFADVALEPSIGFGVAYSPDFFGETGDGVYLNGTLDLSLPMGFGLSFLVGNQDVDGNATSAGFDYTHYVIGLNKSLNMFDFDVSYYDTSDETDCGGEICEAVVFTVSSSF